MIKDKLLATSHFSFSHNVFHSFISLVRKNAVLYDNGLKSSMGYLVEPRYMGYLVEPQ